MLGKIIGVTLILAVFAVEAMCRSRNKKTGVPNYNVITFSDKCIFTEYNLR
jgi:hypothetical protein